MRGELALEMREEVTALIEGGEREGSLCMSDIASAIQSLELEDNEVSELYDEIERRGIELDDDCGQKPSGEPTYVNGNLAVSTTDALQLFLNEVGRYKLLTAEEEVELAKRIERGDQGAIDLMINSNLRLVVSIA